MRGSAGRGAFGRSPAATRPPGRVRRVLAWVLSGALVTAVTAAVSSPTAIAVGLVAALFALWSVRQAAGLVLARRDFHRADTPPRRAYVVLLHDPNPRA